MASVDQMLKLFADLSERGLGDSEVHVHQQYPYLVGFKFAIIHGREPINPEGERIQEVRINIEQLEDSRLHSTSKPPIFIIGDGNPSNSVSIPKVKESNVFEF